MKGIIWGRRLIPQGSRQDVQWLMLIDSLSTLVDLKVPFTPHSWSLHLVKFTSVQKAKKHFQKEGDPFFHFGTNCSPVFLLFMNKDVFLIPRSPVLLLQGLAVVSLILALMSNLCIKFGNLSIPSPLLYSVR